jgi:hypothetical protein
VIIELAIPAKLSFIELKKDKLILKVFFTMKFHLAALKQIVKIKSEDKSK